MKKASWKTKILAACSAVGTYRPAFEPVIDTLAETLQRRDEVGEAYKKDGARPAIAYTNKAGATNICKNPLLVQWDDLNKSALSYWRELGLTPAGLKKIDDGAMQARRRPALIDEVERLGG